MSRRENILKLIVSHFIKTAEPVASKMLVEKYGLKLSSATVRAEMNELEKKGFLEKRHTSSGRVPSKKGYEYYLLKILKTHDNDNNVSDELKNRLQTVVSEKMTSVENVIKKSCEILADMTNLVSVVTGYHNEERLVNAQLIPISNNSATVVLVTDKGFVENKTFVFSNNIDINDIARCIKLLNDRLKGTLINELIPIMESLKPLLSDYIINHEMIYKILFEVFCQFTNEHLNLYGKEEFYKQPEFKNDVKNLKKIVELFEHHNELEKEIVKANYIKNIGTDENINVHVADKKDNDISIISALVSFGENRNGYISLLGPPRMDYCKAINSLNYVASVINKHFKFLEGGNVNERKQKNGRNGTEKIRKKK